MQECLPKQITLATFPSNPFPFLLKNTGLSHFLLYFQYKKSKKQNVAQKNSFSIIYVFLFFSTHLQSSSLLHFSFQISINAAKNKYLMKIISTL